MRLVLLFISLLGLVGTTERETLVARNVQFLVNKDHTLTPLLPVTFEFHQEDGGIADGAITCDTLARRYEDNPAWSTIVLRCNGGKVFRLEKVDFTSSK